MSQGLPATRLGLENKLSGVSHLGHNRRRHVYLVIENYIWTLVLMIMADQARY
jgi:hypothetical protein